MRWIATALLIYATRVLAIDNKPAVPALDPTWTHYDAIVTATVFMEDSGTTAESLAGSDWSVLAGTINTNFRWADTNSFGGAFVYMDTTSGGGLKAPAASGNVVRAAGTIAGVARFDVTTGRVWNTGSAVTTGNGQALFTLSSSPTFAVRVGGATINVAPPSTYTSGTWYPFVLRWTTTTAEMWVVHETDGTKWDDAGAISWPGVTILDTTREGLCGTATAGAQTSIASFLLLDEAIDSNGVAELLADPFVWLMEEPDHKFYLPTPIASRQTPTGVSIFRTANANSDASWRVKYGRADGWDTNGVTTTASTATQSSAEERLRISVTHVSLLDPIVRNTKYNYTIETNTNGSGWAEVQSNGVFWTGTTDNRDTVRGMIMSDCHSWQNQGDDATVKAADRDAVVDLIEYWDTQAVIHLGDITSVAKEGIVDRAGVFAFYNYYNRWWADALKISAWYIVPGNHDWVGCEYYGASDTSGVDTTGFWQQWGTEGWKTCLGNPAETWVAPVTEWALQADIDSNASWVSGLNAQPFETMGRFRHGPVEFFFVDSERFGPVALNTNSNGERNECAWAENATLGATQWTQLQAAIRSSQATFKFPVFHRPDGGYDVDGPTDANEIYRRGAPSTIAYTRPDYEWQARYEWLVLNADGCVSGHDHVASITRQEDSPQFVSIVAGSPQLPFTHGYDAGYNANSSDPSLGPFDAGTPVAGIEALFWSGKRGVWIYDASGGGTTSKTDDVFTLKYVRTTNDARDATLNEVLFTYTIRPRGVASAEGLRGDRR